MSRIGRFAALLVLPAVPPALAAAEPAAQQRITCEAAKRPIEVSGAWARAGAGAARTAAVYLEIRNCGAGYDWLTGASSPAADAAELHAHIRDGAVMRMRRIYAIELPTLSATRLAPGGRHVMLIGLRRKLVAGERLMLFLHFRERGPMPIPIPVEIRAPGARAPEHGGAH